MADVDPRALRATRTAWHMVAEHVLAAARHAATGRIGLQVAPGGFATPPFPRAGAERQILVAIDELVVIDGDTRRTAPLTTLRAAADLVGITPGAPADVYAPTTPLDTDRPLEIEPDTAQHLADWLALSSHALEALHAEHAGEKPAAVQLWPEHFDVATTIPLGADDGVNFGGSLGDEQVADPYLYVGPWAVPAGAFWNQLFGASRTWHEIDDVAAALAFFREGYEQVLAAR
jgi:hypothetical protein